MRSGLSRETGEMLEDDEEGINKNMAGRGNVMYEVSGWWNRAKKPRRHFALLVTAGFAIKSWLSRHQEVWPFYFHLFRKMAFAMAGYTASSPRDFYFFGP